MTCIPAQSALVLGPSICNYPHKRGSLFFSRKSYLDSDTLRVRAARRKFDIDESAALHALKQRYPRLNLQELHTRVKHCAVYFSANNSEGKTYMFDAETLNMIDEESRP
jgi:hypothetical protein